ncbi:ubiquitin-conjugating enzyme/RWD-like protein [Mycena amicta]|nr:ubiquitin-conjugating enzyme/RWD-like protein [Mycena amicta]KAJ7061969.1 ubiquitin-conjugating enzyme/RWD-like protein [Mycena amicta]
MAPLPATTKRIHREIADVKNEDLGQITLSPTENLFVWHGSLPGPEGSVYEGGTFNFVVDLPQDYPFSAPKVILKTRIYHMNISDQGNICLDILKQNWSPALSLFKVILSLSSLLTDPNPKDPLVPSIATQYTRNRKLHDSTARQWTELYARVKPPTPPAPAPKRAAAANRQTQTQTRTSRTQSSTNGAGPSSQRSPIVIDDSDEEATKSRSAGKKRKREAGSVIDLVEDEPSTSRRRAGGSSSRRPIATGEVIDVE